MKKVMFLSISILLAICLMAPWGVLSQPPNGGRFIRKWFVLGPFIEGKQASEAIEYEKIADEVSFGLSGLLDVDSTEYDFRTEGANPALVFEKFIDDIVEHAASLFLSSDDSSLRSNDKNQFRPITY